MRLILLLESSKIKSPLVYSFVSGIETKDSDVITSEFMLAFSSTMKLYKPASELKIYY